METANRWAGGEESLRNDRARSPRDDGDRSDRRKRQRTREARKSDFVAAEFSKNREGGYRGGRDWKSKPEEKPISQQLEEYCSIHAYRDKETGQLKSNHLLKNCRKIQLISEALNHSQQPAVSRGYPVTPGGGAIAY